MPIEIKEMHIKINVDEGQQAQEAASGGSNDMIQECLEQVMQIINDKDER